MGKSTISMAKSHKPLHNYGKSQCLMGKLTIAMAMDSIVMSNYQRVSQLMADGLGKTCPAKALWELCGCGGCAARRQGPVSHREPLCSFAVPLSCSQEFKSQWWFSRASVSNLKPCKTWNGLNDGLWIPSSNQTWQWKIPWTNGGFHGKITYFYGAFSSTPCWITGG